MTKYALLAAAAAVAMTPAIAAAQSMGGMSMPGMKMPAKPAAKPKPKTNVAVKRRTPSVRRKTGARTLPKPVAPAPMAGMKMGPAPGPMSGMDMPQASAPAPMPMPMPMPGMDMGKPAAPAPQVMPGMDMSGPPSDAPATSMDGMAMPQGSSMAGMAAMGDANAPAAGSGTSRLPAAEGMMHGIHVMTGDWMLMVHGYAWGSYTDQSGPRGRDEAFVTSMAMISAERDWGGTRLRLQSMLSLDALMGPKGYPSLFATGETANGVTPLIDRQHPHDLFMELSARIDVPLGKDVNAFLYGGPVAEPALGPSAFMHRASAQYLPLAPITHHWFDSTHITFGVVTAGLSGPKWQLEGSAFRGREPDQNRWDIETPKLDSWSLRATLNPNRYWSAQVSYGRIRSPEALAPRIDEARTTATVQYARGGFSALAGFAIKNRLPGRALSAFIGEANWDLGKHHSLFGRIENVANDELFPDPADPLHDRTFRVTRAELGYAYRLPLTKRLGVAIGGSGFAVAKPAALDAAYGRRPAGWTGFVKLSLGG